MTFGDLLARVRVQRNYTLRDLSALTGIDHGYISHLEHGTKDAPSESTVKALGKALKLDRRETRVLGVLTYQPAPESLVDFILAKPNYTVDDFETLASMCDPSMPPQSHGTWMELMI